MPQLTRTTTPWLRELTPPRTDHPATLLVLPYAGGSSYFFHPVLRHGVGALRVVGAQYPGRGPRIGEPLVERLADLVDPLDELVEEGPGELFLLGYSLGAMVGWQLAQRLEHSGRAPSGVIQMACAPPHATDAESTRLRDLSREELVAHLRRLDGLPTEVLDEPELLEIALDSVGADFRATADYPVQRIERRLRCPLLAVGGSSDPSCRADQVQRWAETTTGVAHIREVPGGHFFLNDRPDEVGRLVEDFCHRHAGGRQVAPRSPDEDQDPPEGRQGRSAPVI